MLYVNAGKAMAPVEAHALSASSPSSAGRDSGGTAMAPAEAHVPARHRLSPRADGGGDDDYCDDGQCCSGCRRKGYHTVIRFVNRFVDRCRRVEVYKPKCSVDAATEPACYQRAACTTDGKYVNVNMDTRHCCVSQHGCECIKTRKV
ncbi:hypothetical protein JDV02_006189 [Purpureocillium takamizusanense]|uniref:Uncharacterized protein n=1 Tax=Purpureocillium takamizusanense TaxID=2060973 RepID=A0A9Q8QHQ7_9HYPO|nr:uncharacterized protein JDV02_006189 [Purpureocillium takamizusanense]UNI20063.1 hypothetical protein JDV02_006189 [Purpureocillium takamizusanense]